MCQPGNQTINRQCWQALLKATGRKSMSNKDARRLLQEAGGCFNKRQHLTSNESRASVEMLRT